MTTTLRLAPGEILLAGGKFDASRRYLRASAAGALFPIVKGPTLSVVNNAVFTYPAIRYDVDGYVRRQTQRWAGDVAPDAANSGTFAALFTLARIS